MLLTRKFLVLVVFLINAALPNTLYAENVYFAGFGYLSDGDAVEKSYPYSHQLNQVETLDGTPFIDRVLRQYVKAFSSDHFKLIWSEQADLRKGESLALAFVLDRETVSYEEICGEHKLLIDLAVQAMVFDFESKSIIGSYPITVQYIDLLDAPPTDDDILTLITQLYAGGVEVNVVDEFFGRLSEVEVKRKYKNRIQVSNVVLEEKSLPFIPKKYAEKEEAFKSFLAQSFSKSLSAQQKVSILPYTKGQAIGDKMTARFSNGKEFSFSIPEADYEIELTLRGFKKADYSSNHSGTSTIYGSYINVRVVEPLSGKTYIDQRFKRGATKLVLSCQKNADDWPAFQDSLLGLFNQFSYQVSEQDKSWAKTHAGNKKVVKQLKELNKVVQQCK